MKQTANKVKAWLILLLAMAALMTMSSCTNGEPSTPPEGDAETIQQENLYTLAKVWGVAKYYHPAFTTGAADWDADLLALLPQVMEAKDSAEVDALLTNWLTGLNDIEPGEVSPPYLGDEGTKVTKVEPSLGWLEDGSISPELGAALVALTSTPVQIGAGPMVFTEWGGTSFENEKPYEDMDYADDNMRYLGLFRFWNVIEFYNPYKDILDYDWDDVLAEFIPRITEGDELAYKLTLCELTTRIQDSHVMYVEDNGGVLDSSWGDRYAPMAISIVEDKVVVTRITAKYADTTSLQVGDVILARDGTEIEVWLQEALKYFSVSRGEPPFFSPPSFQNRTHQDSIKLTVLRDGETQELDVPCYEDGWPERIEKPSHELLPGNIGLINPNYLSREENEIPAIMEALQDTQAIIIDLRQYPINNPYESIADFIMPHPVTFANLTHPDQDFPGRFYMTEPSPYVVGTENPDYYKGKIVILMNEKSISASEFSVMALRLAPNAIVIGSPSAGADGNVADVPLPGNMYTAFTAKGVFTPEGGQTQRIGLQPDILCEPTIAGIAEGRDELMERAIEYIGG